MFSNTAATRNIKTPWIIDPTTHSRLPIASSLTLGQLIAQSCAPDNNQGHSISPSPTRPQKLDLPHRKRHYLNLWLME
jgi:hypothetical protein